MLKVKIDGAEFDVPSGITVMDACTKYAGIEIPHFCYHEKLEIAGNCRMCLVEIKPGPPKPQASCALPIANGMEIFTKTEMVEKARGNVMQFILVNHPLDCPVCDQGGECDLQDQAFLYGSGCSTFDDEKRAVSEKHMGPFIKTNMTRCIHCTRCIRFMDDVAGSSELGAFGRGNTMEIATFLENNITSELSGNIADLCPVGALTHSPHALSYRSWELVRTPSIDVMDGCGSSIFIDSKDDRVVRIVPRENNEINEEWLSDRSRYSCDGLTMQRIDSGYIRKDGKLHKARTDEVIAQVSKKISDANSRIAAIAGAFADAESIFALKHLMNAMHSSYTECREDGAQIITESRESYLFNTGIANIEKSDAILIIGSNPRLEAPILNLRIRRSQIAGGKIALLGEKCDLNYKFYYLGTEKSILEDILSGNHPFSKILHSAKFPIIILGRDACDAKTHSLALELSRKLQRDNWSTFNLLHKTASSVAGLDLGFTNEGSVEAIYKLAESKKIDLIYLLCADGIDVKRLKKSGITIIYQGFIADVSAPEADFVIPAKAYTEKSSTFTNMEGKIQKTTIATCGPEDALPDYNIIQKIAKNLDIITPRFEYICKTQNISEISNNNSVHFSLFKENHYMNNSISKNSRAMANALEMFDATNKSNA